MEANYGILALIPPVVAIGLCFATKQVLISMFAGLFAGALVISNWNPFAAASYSLDALATNMADNVVLLLFTLFMGVGIAFIWRLGGSYALAEAAKRRFKKRRSVCLGTWGLGMVCSVNDCLVAAVDGNVFRDICKDYRISSEKFSYVLDSTAAPAAAFFISDWIAYQISMIGQGLDMAGITGITPVSAYINGLPFNMYSIFTLIFVGMMMYTGRDYGPMLKAEVRALTTGQFTSPTAKPMLDVGSELGEAKKTKPMIMCFVLPIVIAFAIIIAGILYTGITNPDRSGTGIMAILDACDAQKALYWGSFGMAVHDRRDPGSGMVPGLCNKEHGPWRFRSYLRRREHPHRSPSVTGACLLLSGCFRNWYLLGNHGYHDSSCDPAWIRHHRRHHILHRYDWCSCFRRYLRRSLLTCIRYHRYGLHLLRC